MKGAPEGYRRSGATGGGSMGAKGSMGGGRMSSKTKNSSIMSSKRRIGTMGEASASVKKMANKEIKSARKSDGSYGKSSYGRKSVNPGMSKAPTKPSSGKMSSRYAGKMKAMGKKAK